MRLLERDQELGAVVDHLAGLAGGAGGLLVIDGPAGIGKTTLLSAAITQARARGIKALRGRGAPLETEFSYGLVRQLFDPVRVITERWRALTKGAAGLAIRVLNPGDTIGSGFPDVQRDMQASLHGLYWLAVNLASEAPVLLAVDDIQWSDLASLQWLSYLAHRLDGVPLLVVATVRSGEPSTDPTLLAEVLAAAAWPALRPSPLSLDATTAVVKNHFDDSASSIFCVTCHEATRGNPFLLHSLLSTLAAAGERPTDAAARHIHEFGPDDVARELGRRLMRLPAGSSELVEALTVLSDGAAARHVATLAGLDAPRAARVADALRTAGILAPTERLEFIHPVVRAVVAARVPPGARSTMHDRAVRMLAADGLPSDLLAMHLVQVEPNGDPWVVEVMSEAATSATETGDPESAARFLRRALREPPTPPLRPRLKFRLGLAAMATREPNAPDLLNDAVAAFADPTERAHAALQAARALGLAGRHGEAIAICDIGLKGADHRVNHEPIARRLRMEMLLNCSGSSTTISRMYEAVEGDPSTGDTGPTRWLTAITRAFVLTLRGAATSDDLAAVVHDFGANAQIESESIALIGAILLLTWNEKLETARGICTQLISLGQRLGSLNIVASFTCFRAGVGYRSGTIVDAEADARMAFEFNQTTTDIVGLGWPLSFLIDVLIERGDLPGAEAAITESHLGGALPEELFVSALLMESRGRLHLAARRFESALEDFADAAERWRTFGVTNPGIASWRVGATMAHLGRGERAAANRLAQEQLAMAQRSGLSHSIGAAQRVAGLAAIGPERLDLLTASASTLENTPARVEFARSLVALGSEKRRIGLRMESRHPLRRGLEIAYRCGATALAQSAREELAAAGARPRRAASTGPDALTAQEQRIAQMAAQRLTNKEIAQALFVTERTVETHLHNAFAKLGVHDRHELASKLVVRSG